MRDEGETAPSAGRTVTVCVTDVDVVDVRVRLQCKDQADEIRSREKHRDRVHQRPVIISPHTVTFTPKHLHTHHLQKKKKRVKRENHSLDMTQKQRAVVFTLKKQTVREFLATS